MITALRILPILLAVSAGADTFTNRTADGRIFLTITPPARLPHRMTPPVPGGMALKMVSAPTPRKAAAVAPKVIEAIRLDSFKTNADHLLLVGPVPKTRAVRFAPAGVVPVTTKGGPPVVVKPQFNTPVAYPLPYPPYYVVKDSNITETETTALASFRCEIRIGGDVINPRIVVGVFGSAPTNRTVSVNRIVPVAEDSPFVVWDAAQYPE